MSEKKTPILEETFAVIAHQWRQPLNEINALVSSIDNQLYAKGIEDAQIEQQLVEIERITRKMSQSIDDFRGYFQQKRDKEYTVSLQTLFQEIEKEYKVSLKKLDISLQVELDKDILFYGDIHILKQILTTLIENAKDALVARNVYQGMMLLRAEQKERELIIELQDNAGGITKSALAKLFEADFTTKHNSEGTGLGLYMVQKLLNEKFEGDIFVKNRDKGVVFSLLLPLRRGDFNE